MKIAVRKLEHSMQLREVTKEQFIECITDKDKFAKTFVAKCDMLKGWEKVVGAYIDEELAGAILVTISKKKIANLQLLHTFYKFRGKGVARELCNYGLRYAIKNSAGYFRVSSEIEAIPFYEKIGIQFLGKQKSGCQLAMFEITSPKFEKNNYELDDVIYKQINRKGKGGCVEIFQKNFKKGLDIF